jgi:hypothetical protein
MGTLSGGAVKQSDAGFSVTRGHVLGSLASKQKSAWLPLASIIKK